MSKARDTVGAQARQTRGALSIAALAFTIFLSGILFAGTANADTGVCNTRVDNPHNSTHVPGQINVVGTTTCTIPADGIWQTIELYRNGIEVAYKYNYQPHGGVYAMVQANANCAPGVYYATLTVYITGAAISPMNVKSSAVPITC